MSFFNRWLGKSPAQDARSKWRGEPIGEYLDAFLEDCEDEGLQVRVTEVRRSAARQEALYRQGRTAPGPIVTWTRQSAHLRGRAFDITLVGAPQYEDDPEAWQLLGEIGEDLGLKWGGHFRDYGHFELPG